MYIFRLYTRKMALYHSSIVCTKLSFVKKNLLILKRAKSNTKKFYDFFSQKLRIYSIKKSCKSTPYQMKQDWIFYIINFFQLRLSFSYSFIHSFISFFIPVGPHPSLKCSQVSFGRPSWQKVEWLKSMEILTSCCGSLTINRNSTEDEWQKLDSFCLFCNEQLHPHSFSPTFLGKPICTTSNRREMLREPVIVFNA